MPEQKPMTLQDVKDASKNEAPKAAGSSPTEAGSQEAPASTEPKAVEVDYKAELERYRERAEREKRLRIYERTQNRERRRVEASTEEVPEPTEPIANVDELLDSRLERLEKSRVRDEIDDILSEMSEDSYERELVREVYDTEIRPTGYSRKAIREDLKKAYIIANQAKIESFLEQAKSGRRSQAKAQTEAMQKATGGRGEGRAEPVADGALAGYTQEEQKWLSRVGKSKADGDS